MKRRIQGFNSHTGDGTKMAFRGLKTVLGVAVLGAVGVGAVQEVGALTYQSSITQSFTFNEAISVSLSSPNLVISDLAPGSAGDSNVVTVSVTTNALNGYYLSATAGTSSTDTKLTNRSDSNYYFTSVATSADLDSLTADNTWAYRFSTDAGTTWSNYSGLPLDADDDGETGKILIDTGDPLDNRSVDFQIGAKASAAQPAGEYTNVVNFYAVAYDAPSYIMQDVASWGSTLATGEQVDAIDNRDDKHYWVAKLADGNIWMTENLDHNIVTTPNFYTYANTDIGHGATPNTSATWTASTATYTDTTWEWTTTEPESYDPGDLCWNGVMDENWETTLDNGTVACTPESHYQIGNYYNWTAAVAMNDSSSYTTNQTDVDQSICPAGWRLPTYSGSKSYDTLVSTLNLTAGMDGNIHSSPVFFPYAGVWNGGSWDVGSYGVFWSSVVWDSNLAYDLYFDVDGGLSPQDWDGRDYGISVRCAAR